MSQTKDDREKIFNKALEAGQKRDYKKAIALLESLAVEGVSDKPEILLYLARSYHAIKEFPLAVSALNAYLSMKSNDGNGWFFLGRSYLAMDSWTMAITCFQKSLELKPDSSTTLGLLGTAYFKSRQIDEAVSVFEKALYIDPDDVQLNQGYKNSLLIKAIKTYTSGNVALASKMFGFLISNGMQAVMLYVYQGHSFRDLGLFYNAIDSYRKAVELSPQDASLRWYEVSVLMSTGKKAEAEKLIDTLNATFPSEGFGSDGVLKDERATLINMLKNAVFSSKWKSAMEIGRSYYTKFGSDPIVHIFLGEAARNLTKYNDAINHFSKAISVDKSNPAPYYGLLMTYVNMEDWESLDKTIHSVNASVLDADTLSYYTVICDAKLERDSKDLLEKVQSAFSKRPADTVLMKILAQAYLDTGLPELAQRWFSRLISLDVNDENSYLFLIDCYDDLNNKVKMAKAYESYLEKWPQNIEIRKEYIKMLALSKKWQKAANQIELLIPYSKHPLMLTRNLASYRRRSGEYQKSAIAYRTLLQSKTDDRNLMHHYVFCLVKLKLYDKAFSFIKLWHQNYGLDIEGALIESSLALKLKDSDYALKVLKQMFTKHKTNKIIKNRIAQIYYQMGNEDMAYQFDSEYVKQMRK